MPTSVPALPSWFDRSPSGSAPPAGPLARLTLTLLLLVAAADWLFFGREAGLSVTAFGLLALVCLAAHRPSRDWTVARAGLYLLIGGALLESAIDFNFFNGAVLVMLMSAAMMEHGARGCGAGETVWPLAAAALVRACGRWVRFGAIASQVGVPDQAEPVFERAVRVLVPVLLVSLPALALLCCGNALVGSQVSSALDSLARLLHAVHFPSAARILFWIVVATGSLSFLQPFVDSRLARLCHEKWATLRPCDDQRVGFWRAALILGALNTLFVWANGIDAVFLWARRAPPDGLSYSAFLHEGTFSLTITTLFAASVLVLLFQQDESVIRRPWIRGLALACVAQNFFLLSSVALRLELYVEAYQLSVLRVHVVTFLVIVAAGYALLAWRIHFGKSLNWLVLANALAVLSVFYVVQFIDVPGLVARYNTTRWLEGKTKTLDLTYLRELGAPAFPQFARLQREAPDTREAKCVRYDLRETMACWRGSPVNWRAWQWRSASIENRLFANDPLAARPGG
jgi:hypothetical protein